MPNNTHQETIPVVTAQVVPEDSPRNHSSGNRPSRSRRGPYWCWCLVVVVILLIVGGALAAWFFIRRRAISSNDNNEALQDPSSSAPSAASFDIGTSSPTSQPFFEDLLYPPPTEEDCKAIARNATISGREEMYQTDYDLGLDVVLSDNIKMTRTLMDELLDAIQEKIPPSLAGCHMLVDDEFVEDWRFVIFDAFVNGNNVQPGESCMDENLAAQNCHLVSVKLNLFLKGPVRVIDIIDLISDEEVNIRSHLDLSALFSIVKLVQIDSLFPTASPTTMPTRPSKVPSFAPSTKPSISPSAN